MTACPTIKLPAAKPATSGAVPDVDKLALILAEPSLIFLGDETTLAQTGGAVGAWGNRVSGGASYGQSTATRQPAYATTGSILAGLPFADFTATGDTNADRLLWSAAALAATQPQTIIDVVRVDATARCYLDGTQSGTDTIYGDFFQGTVRAAYGDAIASVRCDVGSWAVITRSWSGTGAVEVHCDGRRDAQTAATLPTTGRQLHMGVVSSDNSTSTFDGGWAARLRFTKYIGADRTFFRDVVGAYLMERYQRASNPIAAV